MHTVPESLSPGEAAYIEPATCAWHAVDRGEIKRETVQEAFAEARRRGLRVRVAHLPAAVPRAVAPGKRGVT